MGIIAPAHQVQTFGGRGRLEHRIAGPSSGDLVTPPGASPLGSRIVRIAASFTMPPGTPATPPVFLAALRSAEGIALADIDLAWGVLVATGTGTLRLDAADGEVSLGREAAHSASRILHAGGDATGDTIGTAFENVTGGSGSDNTSIHIVTWGEGQTVLLHPANTKIFAHIRRAARNFATSSKNSLWTSQKNERRGAMVSTSMPRSATYRAHSAWPTVENVHDPISVTWRRSRSAWARASSSRRCSRSPRTITRRRGWTAPTHGSGSATSPCRCSIRRS